MHINIRNGITMETLMDVPRETEGVTTRKILIVDDEDPIRFAMSEYFRPQGYEVDCAQEKEEAVYAD